MSYLYTREEGAYLLKLARLEMETHLGIRRDRQGDSVGEAVVDHGHVFLEKRGVFVTLHGKADGKLRGCIGSIGAHRPVEEGIRVNAVNAAFKDPRFSPLVGEELDRVCLEISILTEPEPLAAAGGDALLSQVRPFLDGVILEKDGKGATFLPQVWEQLPEPAAFFSHLCAKAGLDRNAWKKKGLTVSIYQVQSFEENRDG